MLDVTRRIRGRKSIYVNFIHCFFITFFCISLFLLWRYWRNHALTVLTCISIHFSEIRPPNGQCNDDYRRRLSTLVHSLSKYEIPCIFNETTTAFKEEEKDKEEQISELKEVESMLHGVRQKHMNELESYCCDVKSQHPFLNYPLRKYQCEAVRWMIFKESQDYIAEGTKHKFL